MNKHLCLRDRMVQYDGIDSFLHEHCLLSFFLFTWLLSIVAIGVSISLLSDLRYVYLVFNGPEESF